MNPRTIPFGRPWIDDDDRRAVQRVLEGHILTHGPECKAFEAEFGEFLGAGAHCITTSSCMAALHLAYLHFRIGPGDEVIVPAQTHTATVHAVEWVGARPVFVDCDPATGNLTAEAIAAAVTPRTRAISVVHFLGIPCDMPRIMEVATRRDLTVVEDCALAVGARIGQKHVGLFGDAGCFSFYPVKHMTTGEGGMFLSRHATVVEGVGKLRAFGVDRTHSERSVPGMYDVPTLGLNYRMSEMQAALGRSQLRRVGAMLERRRVSFEALKRGLAGALGTRILDATDPAARSSHYCLSVVLEGPLAARRNDVVARLNTAGVGTSIYYPQPVPRMTYYRNKYGYDSSRFRHAEDISDHSIALPVGPHLTDDDLTYIVAQWRQTVEELGS
jgi:dTDP-4-amino-4,6-dideoxygalactose transaminase